MEAKTVKIEDIINGAYSPIPIEVIPNTMGINLVCVDSITYQKQDDGQLTYLTINFIPSKTGEK